MTMMDTHVSESWGVVDRETGPKMVTAALMAIDQGQPRPRLIAHGKDREQALARLGEKLLKVDRDIHRALEAVAKASCSPLPQPIRAAIVIHGPEQEWLSGLDGPDDWRECLSKAHCFETVEEAIEHCKTLGPGWQVISNPDNQLEEIHYTHEPLASGLLKGYREELERKG